MATGFRVDQPLGAGAGANKKARDDLWVDTSCEVYDTGAGGAVTWALGVPIGSATALVAGTPITFVPDMGGTYRLSQTRDGVTLDRVFRVTKDSAGVATGALCLPAFREEEGDSDGITGQGSTAGMLPLHKAIRDRLGLGITVTARSNAAFTLNARPISLLQIDQCDGTVSAANLPEVLAAEDGFVCLLSVGATPITVTPFAGNYLDEDTNPITYPAFSLVMFVSMFGDSWTPYIISLRTIMSNAGATLVHGINRRTAGAAFTMPPLVGSPYGVLAVVFINLTGVDVTLTAAGANRFETGVSSPTYVVPGARRSVTFLDDGTIWEPSAAP